ncbi:MAG TPA: HdeA/HdeB family chaperone [Stellaceae bacterium]|nr:HdeA/HdeB family chaperone [Stellaceae bacterium]
MNRKTAFVLLSGLLCACAPVQPPGPPAPPPAPAPAPAPAAESTTNHYVTIQRASCDTYLQLSADDRAAASMFYIGYVSRRYGARAINVSTIPSIEGLALDYCGINPNRTVASAFAEAYLEARRW